MGGGVNGASFGFRLTRMGMRKVIVLEKRGAASGATGLWSGLVRMHYAKEVEARRALSSFVYISNWSDRVGGECGFTKTGFIRTVAPKNNAKLRANVAMLQGIGVDTRLITPAELRELAPTIWSEDLELAAYEPHSGYADPTATTLSLLHAARQRGAELRQQVEALGFVMEGERVTGVRTREGLIKAETVVCAVVGWAMAPFAQLRRPLPRC